MLLKVLYVRPRVLFKSTGFRTVFPILPHVSCYTTICCGKFEFPQAVSSDVRDRTAQKNKAVKSAKAVINDTFTCVSGKLKRPALMPVYSTRSGPSIAGNQSWDTILTISWPLESKFQGSGSTKKKAEEQAAQKALDELKKENVLLSNGQLSLGVCSEPRGQPQNLLQFNSCSESTETKEQATHPSCDGFLEITAPSSNRQPVCDLPPEQPHPLPEYSVPYTPTCGPVPTEGVAVVSEEELTELGKKFSNAKSTLLQCFVQVSRHVKNPNLRVWPNFSRVRKCTELLWQATYRLKWPEEKEFSGIAKTRAEAEKWAVLSSLHWLIKVGSLHPAGYPILYTEKELSEYLENAKKPARIQLPPAVISDIEDIVTNFNSFKSLLDEDRAVSEQEITNKFEFPEDKIPREELGEDMEAEKAVNRSSPLAGWNVSDGSPIDALTGGPLSSFTPAQRKAIDDGMFRSTYERIIEGKGPIAPVLPIAEQRHEILDLIRRNQVVIISGDTGCGKSTQVPQFLLDSFALDHRGSECNIMMVQPRRLAVHSLAEAVARHRGEKVGETVGYQMRLNHIFPQQPLGRIVFCSTGIILMRLTTCPELKGVSHLIIDEVHARDWFTDFTLVIVKDLLRANPSLKVILMSASANASLLSRYFNYAPLIHVNGRAFPVQQHFLEDIYDILSISDKVKTCKESEKPVIDQQLVVKLIQHIDINKPVDGAILCFLPGWKEIKNLYIKLKDFYPSEQTHWVLPVHSRLSRLEQEHIFDKPPKGVRKIILATNIAETSITINDAVYVIDPGIHQETRYDAGSGRCSLDYEWISKANVQQRAGRAGRVQPGESYHLYTKQRYEELNPFPVVDMQRMSLENIIMCIKAYDSNVKVVEFLNRALEPPTPAAIENAIGELQNIGVLDESEQLTVLGYRLVCFSSHPRLSKALVYAALFRCLIPVASIVAGLNSSRAVWSIDSSAASGEPLRLVKNKFHNSSDHLAFANLLAKFCQHSNISGDADQLFSKIKADVGSLDFLKGVRNVLINRLKTANVISDIGRAKDEWDPVNFHMNNDEMVKAALLVGLSDRIVRVRRGCIKKGVVKQDETVFLSDKHDVTLIKTDSVNYKKKTYLDFIMYYDAGYHRESGAFILRDTSQISALAALLLSGNKLRLSQEGPDESVLTLDSRPQLSFTCSAREAELLMGLRISLNETCEYLLRTIGLREASELSTVVSRHHDLQIDLLSKLLQTSCE